MRTLARRLGEDEDLWGLVGLLHDIDYDYVGRDPLKHGLGALELLKGVLPGFPSRPQDISELNIILFVGNAFINYCAS